MTPRFFSGRECWVFRAHVLNDLCGHHPDLMGEALRGHERPTYLLYSPLREVNHGPFGLTGPCGSHALAVTTTCLAISRDPHQRGQPGMCRVVPFRAILSVELGEALTLGWLVVHFASEGRMASEVVFFQSSGIDHFREIVRLWCRSMPAVGVHTSRDEDWERVLTRSPAYLARQMAPLIVEGEHVEALLSAPETWSTGRGKPNCLSAAALIVATDRAVMIAESERPDRPGALVFGVNVVCIARTAVTRTTVQRLDGPASRVAALSLTLEAQSVRADVTTAVGEPSNALHDIAQLLEPRFHLA